MTGIFFGKVDLPTGAHWTVPFYLSDFLCQTTWGVCMCVCLSALLSVNLSMHYKLFCVSITPHVCVSGFEPVCWLVHVQHTLWIVIGGMTSLARHIVNQRLALLHSALPLCLFRGGTDGQAPTLDHINTTTNTLTSAASFICL